MQNLSRKASSATGHSKSNSLQGISKKSRSAGDEFDTDCVPHETLIDFNHAMFKSGSVFGQVASAVDSSHHKESLGMDMHGADHYHDDEHHHIATDPLDISCSQRIVSLIKDHWNVPKKSKDPEEQEIEKSLCLYCLRSIAFNRFVLFASAFMIQFCCGSLYSWSNFNKPIDKLVYNDANAAMAVNTFYIAVMIFGCSTAVSGPWLERNGPRKALFTGTALVCLGHCITALSLHLRSIVGVYIGYGVFAGCGLGICYISPVSTLQKWFPDYRGLASGFAVGGFGAGSIVWSKVYLPLINAAGLPATFAILAAILTVTMAVCGISLRTIPQGYVPEGYTTPATLTTAFAPPSSSSSSPSSHVHDDEKLDATTRLQPLTANPLFQSTNATSPSSSNVVAAALATSAAVVAATPDLKSVTPDRAVNMTATQFASHFTLVDAIHSYDFWLLWIAFLGNELFGLVVLSRLADMCRDLFGQSADAAANVVSINGAFNCVGRLALPMITDLLMHCLQSRTGRDVNPAWARKCVFLFTLGVQVAIVSVLYRVIATRNYDAFRALMWTLTFVYGAGFGTIPALITDMFNASNIGALHGLILTAWSIGGVAGGLAFNRVFLDQRPNGLEAQYTTNLNWILVVIVLGLGFVMLVRTEPKKRANKDGYECGL